MVAVVHLVVPALNFVVATLIPDFAAFGLVVPLVIYLVVPIFVVAALALFVIAALAVLVHYFIVMAFPRSTTMLRISRP